MGDGVRKHARKTHTAWLKSVDEASLSRDRETESKPSTYCFMEVDDQNSGDNVNTIPTLTHCRDIYDDGMPTHVRQASFCTATAMSISMHSGSSSMLHPRMVPHPSMLPGGIHAAENAHRMPPQQPEFPSEPLMSRMSAPCHSDWSPCRECTPWSSEGLPPLPPPPPEYIRETWSKEFDALLARTSETTQQKRPSPPTVFELDDPLCLTPPMVPSTMNSSSQCLSPFELEEKRPSKMARVSLVPLKPEPKRSVPVDLPVELPQEGFASSETALAVPLNEVPLNETEYFDFFEALLAM